MKRSVIWVALALVGIAVAASGGYWWGLKQIEKSSTETSTETAASATKKILYYRNPMGLSDTSPEPKQDSMGMDYIPVYEGDEVQPGQIKISPEKVQKLGVRTESATLRESVRTVRAVGQFQLDERRLHTVTTKFEGYIEKLHVNATGQPVKRGQPLMEVYSPELVSAQEEYLIAWNGRQSLSNGTEESLVGVSRLAESALKRLRNWDISDSQLQRLKKDGKATRTLTLYSPANGVVLEKMAVAGMRFMPGEPLFKIADLSAIWLLADVFEQDLALVHVGQLVKISVNAYPDKELTGKIAYIYPTVAPETRTAKVRVELDNPGGILKPEMYATVQLVSGHGKANALMVPDSAVLDSGTRQIVLVQRAEGLFESREVKLGMRGNGYVEVIEGISAGENVVVSANFLIDAESNLKAAIGGFGHSAHGNQDKPVTDKPATPVVSSEHKGH
ncbi:efflux RND transporter periplasmic adaptor subunit [Methylotenera sp.]|uniref:efflux RND transporter periplasmic adaptor subunit n=1 Tax=Methylotenera sp. TaxID=2051956 RepID=UPI002732C615|nr:efflux RND transporter periplasmic adaptor subunit [Methylotenera sp.]MDP3211580.1 efflux RND transporter periplasmic adaptor subunit [Methylotenera sp.]